MCLPRFSIQLPWEESTTLGSLTPVRIIPITSLVSLVQFFWDRQGKKNENSSCWIRVSQPWAGKNWGAMWIPRIGQEVIVEFLEGDPDRPIITGRVYNAEAMPPYQLPDNGTRSTFMSRSSKEGGSANYNEIRFEDKK